MSVKQHSNDLIEVMMSLTLRWGLSWNVLFAAGSSCVDDTLQIAHDC